MITTVIFDLDDTLYDEIDYCQSGFNAIARFIADLPSAQTADQIYARLWQQFETGNHTKTFNAALDELGIGYDDEFISSAVQIYRGHTPQITLPTDSRDVLDRLSEKYTLALLTDGFLPAQQLKVQALGIENYFKCIIYTEQLGRQFWKPSPAGFEKIIETLNTKPQTTVYIADNEEKDFIAPNKLGILTVQIRRPARLHTAGSPKSDAKARYLIQKISRLPDLLEKL